jgi:hypothetical protein
MALKRYVEEQATRVVPESETVLLEPSKVEREC